MTKTDHRHILEQSHNDDDKDAEGSNRIEEVIVQMPAQKTQTYFFYRVSLS